ncbi:hypothetical protein ACWT_5830 [Actinoplanes sp. SE50]|uniref:hypothetical protein n=1 Tax=unclassified Actinoplanes TaxID=2626549 RepID=UPI00023EBC21|nr:MULTISPECIES: hypothetical protein [unclassified Actinoplanes]AEV86848.1 hypothetical protein ACPL_5961 [Actinoplanes sp. SE50/110]ATO85245.1 hypothetical protein ACWT_5830 [Actinoplanes sp. SE50]SLM02655.1 hypothetical protein ACSP50_5937 [Actinoplanes sp. SE50/110]
MTIADAFDGVFPEAPSNAATTTATRPARPTVVPLRPADTTRAKARQRPHAVIRLARIVYLDAADSWITEERSPSAKTVWRTDYTAGLDTVWTPYRYWTYAWRPIAVLAALFLDALKFLFIHPFRGPVSTAIIAALILLATH